MSTNPRTSNYILDENVTFCQNHLPGLDAGKYKLELTQTIQEATDGDTATQGDALPRTYTATEYYAVKGDRFFISQPANTIHSIFPQNSGQFNKVLPQVVFSKTKFPWIRTPKSGTMKYVDNDSTDVATWLWVLLLDENDKNNFPGLELTPKNGTVQDLFPAVGDTFCSYFTTGDTPTNSLDVGESTTDKIQYIDIPGELFVQLAPSMADLQLMAHGRSVATDPGDSNVSKDPDLGSYSVVFGNRLPSEEVTKSTAYLVSLEGLQDYLPGNDDDAPTTAIPTGDSMRLAVLKSWSFFNKENPVKFDATLEALNDAKTSQPLKPNLTLPYDNSGTLLDNALKMGYTPMNETLRTGEKTVSWYRGPFTPYEVNPKNFKLPFSSSDSALVFDPTTGLFDASYAAAWELGRLMALQNKSFSTELYNWKKGISRDIINNIEKLLIEGMIDEMPTQTTKPFDASTSSLQTKAINSIVQLLTDAS
ncbi:hypothetical protein [Pseudotenacibaculum haliotis]|uniref:Uncharacterized protein n=1 Tax=Pseudotenacibaculum haliotis TaxID=1862138 RepID=A0ABW5LWE6_9FLAO